MVLKNSNEQLKMAMDEIIGIEPLVREEDKTKFLTKVHKKQKTYLVPKLLTALLFIGLAGWLLFLALNSGGLQQASPADKNIKTIETVLNQMLTGPSKEFSKVMDALENAVPKTGEGVNSGIITSTPDPLRQYTDKYFKPYFTEEGLTDYINTSGLTFLMQADWYGYVLKVNDLKIEKLEMEGNYYDFTVTVSFQKTGSDQQNTAEVTGQINVNDEGKIQVFSMFGDGGLLEKMTEGR